jgi:hypothetical protein
MYLQYSYFSKCCSSHVVTDSRFRCLLVCGKFKKTLGFSQADLALRALKFCSNSFLLHYTHTALKVLLASAQSGEQLQDESLDWLVGVACSWAALRSSLRVSLQQTLN